LACEGKHWSYYNNIKILKDNNISENNQESEANKEGQEGGRAGHGFTRRCRRRQRNCRVIKAHGEEE